VGSGGEKGKARREPAIGGRQQPGWGLGSGGKREKEGGSVGGRQHPGPLLSSSLPFFSSLPSQGAAYRLLLPPPSFCFFPPLSFQGAAHRLPLPSSLIPRSPTSPFSVCCLPPAAASILLFRPSRHSPLGVMRTAYRCLHPSSPRSRPISFPPFSPLSSQGRAYRLPLPPFFPFCAPSPVRVPPASDRCSCPLAFPRSSLSGWCLPPTAVSLVSPFPASSLSGRCLPPHAATLSPSCFLLLSPQGAAGRLQVPPFLVPPFPASCLLGCCLYRLPLPPPHAFPPQSHRLLPTACY
jgi:hypothetical protein